jgi:hypothetical protein
MERGLGLQAGRRDAEHLKLTLNGICGVRGIAGFEGGSDEPAALFRPYIPKKKNIVDSSQTPMLTRVGSERARDPAGEALRVAVAHGIGRFIAFAGFGQEEAFLDDQPR